MASLPYPLDRLGNHDRVNGVPKLKQMRAESPMSSTAQGNALGEKDIYNIYAPCKGNSIVPQIVALTGRVVYLELLYTQGVALGCGGRWAFSPLFIKKKPKAFALGFSFFSNQ